MHHAPYAVDQIAAELEGARLRSWEGDGGDTGSDARGGVVQLDCCCGWKGVGGTCSVNCDVFASERLADEVGHHAAVKGMPGGREIR